ncbi:MAG: FAD-dependent oxidoreductase [Deltaproteobacteria bacterium]|nr:FAD-dependent oxidoreductase [Deltaproteobacteria bacterium]
MSKARTIAVLGGGVSGLTFAATLRERGGPRAVVFEREARVGGKSCTIEIDGRPHDMGATMGVPIDYRRVLDFSRAAGIELDRFPEERHWCLERGEPVSLNKKRELPKVLAQAARYMWLHATKWRGVNGTGLHHAQSELHTTWSELVKRDGLEAVSDRTLVYRAGYGYGFDDEVPAVMYANLFRPQTFLGLTFRPSFVWRGGTQRIWETLAKDLDVRTSTPIERIERDADGVTVHSNAGKERFDELVITTNPSDALPLLDARDDERRWFTQVRTWPYATFACAVPGLDEGRTGVGYINANMRKDREGHPMAWVKRHADHDVAIFHLFAPPHLSDDQIAERIAGDVKRLGGRLDKVHVARRWKFFPHFTSAFMQSGGLQEVERWQGTQRTWLIGEVLSFASMGRVAELATSLARRLS